MDPIITSLLDTDIYKISMLQVYYHQYPSATGRWEFVCRNDVKLGFLAFDIQKQIDMLKDLRLTNEEREYLKSLGYFKEDFLDWFQNDFNLGNSKVFVQRTCKGELVIHVSGKLIDINMFEVYILAIVNELYFNNDREINSLFIDDIFNKGREILSVKEDMLAKVPSLKFAEFGTRRRYSKEWQEYIIGSLIKNCPRNIIGTSNVYFAKKFGIKPIGTCAHEFTMSHLGLVDRIEQAQKRALCVWQQEYGTNLGIALSDTFTTDAFLKDFDEQLSKSYRGVRQDSGDVYEFGEKIIKHYKKMGIDPTTKDIIFSDSLDIEKCINIWNYFVGRIGVSFGIGTNLSCDTSRGSLNIVMKLMECNGVPLVKLSDDLGKTMGNSEMVEKVKRAYGVE